MFRRLGPLSSVPGEVRVRCCSLLAGPNPQRRRVPIRVRVATCEVADLPTCDQLLQNDRFDSAVGSSAPAVTRPWEETSDEPASNILHPALSLHQLVHNASDAELVAMWDQLPTRKPAAEERSLSQGEQRSEHRDTHSDPDVEEIDLAAAWLAQSASNESTFRNSTKANRGQPYRLPKQLLDIASGRATEAQAFQRPQREDIAERVPRLGRNPAPLRPRSGNRMGNNPAGYFRQPAETHHAVTTEWEAPQQVQNAVEALSGFRSESRPLGVPRVAESAANRRAPVTRSRRGAPEDSDDMRDSEADFLRNLNTVRNT